MMKNSQRCFHMATKNCRMKSTGGFISFQRPSSLMSIMYTFMPQKTMTARLLKLQDRPICSATVSQRHLWLPPLSMANITTPYL